MIRIQLGCLAGSFEFFRPALRVVTFTFGGNPAATLSPIVDSLRSCDLLAELALPFRPVLSQIPATPKETTCNPNGRIN